MLCDILVLEINLNENFQTCTTMAPLRNLFEFNIFIHVLKCTLFEKCCAF